MNSAIAVGMAATLLLVRGPSATLLWFRLAAALLRTIFGGLDAGPIDGAQNIAERRYVPKAT